MGYSFLHNDSVFLLGSGGAILFEDGVNLGPTFTNFLYLSTFLCCLQKRGDLFGFVRT